MKKRKQNLFLISVDKRGLALIYKKTIENMIFSYSVVEGAKDCPDCVVFKSVDIQKQ